MKSVSETAPEDSTDLKLQYVSGTSYTDNNLHFIEPIPAGCCRLFINELPYGEHTDLCINSTDPSKNTLDVAAAVNAGLREMKSWRCSENTSMKLKVARSQKYVYANPSSHGMYVDGRKLDEIVLL